MKRWLGGKMHPTPTPGQRRVIVNYHSIGDGEWAIQESAFEKQILWLSTHARIVPLPELLASSGENETLQVSITFDDGYHSVANRAQPVLSRHGAQATVFILTGRLSESEHAASDANRGDYPDECFLSRKDVRDLERAGWVIGSHGSDHTILTRLTPNELEKELRSSRDDIREMTGKDCVHFCYPWGRHNPEVRKACADAGYSHGFTCRHASIPEDCAPFEVPRLDVRREYCLTDYKALVSGQWDFIGTFQRLRGRR